MLRNGALALLAGIGLLVFASQTRWQTIEDEPLIITDGKGYYSYLPAAFIFHDFSYGFIKTTDSLHYPEGEWVHFFHVTEKGNVNKYFVGTAVLMAPFFGAAMVVASFTGDAIDGFSPSFQIAVGVAALFYLALGLLFLQLFLQLLGYKRKAIIPALLMLVFGTNLLFYAVYEPSMSHVYSFFAVSAFLYFSARAIIYQHERFWILAAFALGLVALIRPTNGLIVLALPVVASGIFPIITSLERLVQKPVLFFLSIIVFVGVVALQPILYLIQVGAPMFWSYQGEGFNFLSPEFFNVLFSYRRGLFVYAPILLLAVIGIFAMRKRNEMQANALLFFLLVITWIISSWWMWYYGGAFGHRAFIEYIPFFAIGLVHLIQFGWGIFRPWFVIILGLMCIGIQGVQTYQYVHHILPFDGIDRTKYRSLFLRTGEDLQWYYPGNSGQDSYAGMDSTVLIHDMEASHDWGGEQQISDSIAFSGTKSSCLKQDNFGITLRIKAKDIPVSANVVRISGMVNSSSWQSDVSFVCTIQDSTEAAYFWRKKPLRPQFSFGTEWNKCSAVFFCGAARHASDTFVLYIMKEDQHEVCLDDMEITFIHAR